MKNFVVAFDYNGFLFTAKVSVKRSFGKMIISTTLESRELAFLLEYGKLWFIQQEKGFDLLLYKEDGSFEQLRWNIQHEYIDKAEIVDPEAFSLS